MKPANPNHRYGRLIGLLMISGNVYWLGISLFLFYQYHFTTILFVVRLPDWLLALHAGMSIAGILLGLLIVNRRIRFIKWSILELVLVSIGIVIEVLVVSSVLWDG